MTPERLHSIESLFEQALGLPEVEREAFLACACADDGDLHREVGELLAVVPRDGSSLREAVIAEARMLVGDAIVTQIGRRIGPFRVLGPLGQGGMGAVYVAQRE